MSKPSTNLTLNAGIKQMAKEIMAARSFGSLTALVEQLIRDEYDNRIEKKEVKNEGLKLPNIPKAPLLAPFSFECGAILSMLGFHIFA